MVGYSKRSPPPLSLLLLQEHKNCGEMSEIEAKVKYVKLARSLRTYGVSFFLVKVSWPGWDQGLPVSSLLSSVNKFVLVRTLALTDVASGQL